MTPELTGAVLQFGAMGILAVAVYLGIQQMSKKDEAMVEALRLANQALLECMRMKAEVDERLKHLENRQP